MSHLDVLEKMVDTPETPKIVPVPSLKPFKSQHKHELKLVLAHLKIFLI